MPIKRPEPTRSYFGWLAIAIAVLMVIFVAYVVVDTVNDINQDEARKHLLPY